MQTRQNVGLQKKHKGNTKNKSEKIQDLINSQLGNTQVLARIQWVNSLMFEALVKQYGDFKAIDHRRLCHIAHALLVIALIWFFNI